MLWCCTYALAGLTLHARIAAQRIANSESLKRIAVKKRPQGASEYSLALWGRFVFNGGLG
ncbi:hypothetical protein HAALTHF_04220n [Vreelandella aquamarina]|nr:hypothetical protein HAALTHF_04220n [Halomonas axialensis]